MQVLLWQIISIGAFVLYSTTAFTVTCKEGSVKVQFGVPSNVSCEYDIPTSDVIGFYWKQNDEIILRLEDGTRRGGKRLGEFNISADGTMIMNNPQFGDSGFYTFLVVSRSVGNKNGILRVFVTEVIDPSETTKTGTRPSIVITPAYATTTSSQLPVGLVIAVVILIIVVTIVIIIIAFYFKRKKRQNQKRQESTAGGDMHSNPQCVPLKEKVDEKKTVDSRDSDLYEVMEKLIADEIPIEKALQKVLSILDLNKAPKDSSEAMEQWIYGKLEECKENAMLSEGLAMVLLFTVIKEKNKDVKETTYLIPLEDIKSHLKKLLNDGYINDNDLINALMKLLKKEKINEKYFVEIVWIEGIQDPVYFFMKATLRLPKRKSSIIPEQWRVLEKDPEIYPKKYLTAVGLLVGNSEFTSKECSDLLFELVKSKEKIFKSNIILTEGRKILLKIVSDPDTFVGLLIKLNCNAKLSVYEVLDVLEEVCTSYQLEGRTVARITAKFFVELPNKEKNVALFVKCFEKWDVLISSNVLTEEDCEFGIAEILKDKTIENVIFNKINKSKWFSDKANAEREPCFKRIVYLRLRIIDNDKVQLTETWDFVKSLSLDKKFEMVKKLLIAWLQTGMLKARTIIKIAYLIQIETKREDLLESLQSELRKLRKEDLKEQLMHLRIQIKEDLKGMFISRNMNPTKFARKDQHNQFVELLHSNGIISDYYMKELTCSEKDETVDETSKTTMKSSTMLSVGFD